MKLFSLLQVGTQISFSLIFKRRPWSCSAWSETYENDVSQFASWSVTYHIRNALPSNWVIFAFSREELHQVDSTLTLNCESCTIFLYFNYNFTSHTVMVAFYLFSFYLNFVQHFRRRESTDIEDLFIAHIIGMDTMARGLRNAAKLIEVTYCIITYTYLLTFL